MIFWPRDSSTFTVIKDTVIALAAAFTAGVALAGLHTWRRKLRGGDEYDVARRLLHEAIRLREAMVQFRNPFQQPDWKWIAERMPDLEAARLQAEVLWEKKVDSALEALQKCITRLWLGWQDFQAYRDDAKSSEFAKARATVSATDPQKDAFGREVEKAIDAVRDFVRPFIATKPPLPRRCITRVKGMATRVWRALLRGKPKDDSVSSA